LAGWPGVLLCPTPLPGGIPTGKGVGRDFT